MLEVHCGMIGAQKPKRNSVVVCVLCNNGSGIASQPRNLPCVTYHRSVPLRTGEEWRKGLLDPF